MKTKLLSLAILVSLNSFVLCDKISVQIDKEELANTVSDEFISFSVDPTWMAEEDEYKVDCSCKKTALSPAFIRLSVDSLQELSDERTFKYVNLNKVVLDEESLSKIMKWVKIAKFTPVLVLDDAFRMSSRTWETNTVLKMLTLVEKIGIDDCVIELVFDCKIKSMEQYVKDLKILKTIIDAFSMNKEGKWRISSSSKPGCLANKNSLQLFLKESSGLINATVLNMNGTEDVFETMSDSKRKDFMKSLEGVNFWRVLSSNSNLLAKNNGLSWLKNMGDSAKNGYSSVFKKINSNDFEKLNLVYYINLLLKKYAGPKVLKLSPVNSQNKDVQVYGHCAQLPQGPLPSGVTLYAVNQGRGSSIISFNVSAKGEANVFSFILNENDNGDFYVNGKKIIEKNDVVPSVYSSDEFGKLEVLLPPKSVGFWILQRSDVSVCSDDDEKSDDSGYDVIERSELVNQMRTPTVIRVKRFSDDDSENTTESDSKYEDNTLTMTTESFGKILEYLESMAKIERELSDLEESILSGSPMEENFENLKKIEDNNHNRVRRQADDSQSNAFKIGNDDLAIELKSSNNKDIDNINLSLPNLSSVLHYLQNSLKENAKNLFNINESPQSGENNVNTNKQESNIQDIPKLKHISFPKKYDSNLLNNQMHNSNIYKVSTKRSIDYPRKSLQNVIKKIDSTNLNDISESLKGIKLQDLTVKERNKLKNLLKKMEFKLHNAKSKYEHIRITRSTDTTRKYSDDKTNVSNTQSNDFGKTISAMSEVKNSTLKPSPVYIPDGQNPTKNVDDAFSTLGDQTLSDKVFKTKPADVLSVSKLNETRSHKIMVNDDLEPSASNIVSHFRVKPDNNGNNINGSIKIPARGKSNKNEKTVSRMKSSSNVLNNTKSQTRNAESDDQKPQLTRENIPSKTTIQRIPKRNLEKDNNTENDDHEASSSIRVSQFRANPPNEFRNENVKNNGTFSKNINIDGKVIRKKIVRRVKKVKKPSKEGNQSRSKEEETDSSVDTQRRSNASIGARLNTSKNTEQDDSERTSSNKGEISIKNLPKVSDSESSNIEERPVESSKSLSNSIKSKLNTIRNSENENQKPSMSDGFSRINTKPISEILENIKLPSVETKPFESLKSISDSIVARLNAARNSENDDQESASSDGALGVNIKPIDEILANIKLPTLSLPNDVSRNEQDSSASKVTLQEKVESLNRMIEENLSKTQDSVLSDIKPVPSLKDFTESIVQRLNSARNSKDDQSSLSSNGVEVKLNLPTAVNTKPVESLKSITDSIVSKLNAARNAENDDEDSSSNDEVSQIGEILENIKLPNIELPKIEIKPIESLKSISDSISSKLNAARNALNNDQESSTSDDVSQINIKPISEILENIKLPTIELPKVETIPADSLKSIKDSIVSKFNKARNALNNDQESFSSDDVSQINIKPIGEILENIKLPTVELPNVESLKSISDSLVSKLNAARNADNDDQESSNDAVSQINIKPISEILENIKLPTIELPSVEIKPVESLKSISDSIMSTLNTARNTENDDQESSPSSGNLRINTKPIGEILDDLKFPNINIRPMVPENTRNNKARNRGTNNDNTKRLLLRNPEAASSTSLDGLIQRARNLLTNINKPQNRNSVRGRNRDSLSSSSTVKISVQPAISSKKIKEQLLQQELKLKELERKVRERLSEVGLVNAQNRRFPSVVKREVNNEDLSNERGLYKDALLGDVLKSDEELEGEEKEHKERLSDIAAEKFTLDDIREGIKNLNKNDSSFDSAVKSVGDFFSSMSDKVKKWWSNVSS